MKKKNAHCETYSCTIDGELLRHRGLKSGRKLTDDPTHDQVRIRKFENGGMAITASQFAIPPYVNNVF